MSGAAGGGSCFDGGRNIGGRASGDPVGELWAMAVPASRNSGAARAARAKMDVIGEGSLIPPARKLGKKTGVPWIDDGIALLRPADRWREGENGGESSTPP